MANQSQLDVADWAELVNLVARANNALGMVGVVTEEEGYPKERTLTYYSPSGRPILKFGLSKYNGEWHIGSQSHMPLMDIANP